MKTVFKITLCVILNSTKKLTMPIQNWSQALSQFSIYFEGRLKGVLDI